MDRHQFYEYESLVHRTNLKVGVVWGMALEIVALLCVCVCERVDFTQSNVSKAGMSHLQFNIVSVIKL